MGKNKKKRSKIKKEAKTAKQQAQTSTLPRSSYNARSSFELSLPPTSTLAEALSWLPPEEKVVQCLRLENLDTGPKDPRIIFFRKLDGAFARLFCNGCVRFMENIALKCNDTPEVLPVWCGLSPQQRVRLVTELIVGLVCEGGDGDDTSLEAVQTEQHYLAYLAVWRTISGCLTVELDCEGEHGECPLRLEAIQKSCPDYWGEHSNKSAETEEQREERLRKIAIRTKVAARQKKKIEEKLNHGVDIDNLSETSKKKQRAPSELKGDEDDEDDGDGDNSCIEILGRLMKRHNRVFEGGPPPQSSRAHLKPTWSKLEDREIYRTFVNRMLCDEAFQEHNEPTILCPMPLKYLNFSWKLNDDATQSKFHKALRLLFFECGQINYQSNIVNGMWDLHCGELDDGTYANPKKHERVVNVHKTIQKWRLAFEETYNETQFYQDHRCIIAVCSNEVRQCDLSHQNWTFAFYSVLRDQYIPFIHSYGNYQKRLDIHRSLLDLDKPTKCYTPTHETFCHPKEYNYNDDSVGYGYEQCHSEGCYTYDKNNLLKCSGCKVVKYCSRECQKKDWARHKKDCKKLATMYRDKEGRSKICREC